MTSSTDELASPSLARAYVEAVQERISALDGCELIDALARVARVYQEFPELLERPRRGEWPLGTIVLDKIARSDSPASLREALYLLGRVRELRWSEIEPVVNVLRREGRADSILEIISAVLDRAILTDEESAAGFAELLKDLLANDHALEIDGGGLAQLVRSARSRLSHPLRGRDQPGGREALLNLAERLRVSPRPAPPKSHRERAWPSGRLSFDEFLLQWPCQIELPPDLDDAAFIDAAYQAILLRLPDAAERDELLPLLERGAVTRPWIIENLLASAELRSLQRRLRVNYAGQVITEPGSVGAEDMPVVFWPWSPVN